MRRNGSTLTEVLIAILILSIGVVSILSLFPLSVMRSVKAVQLTRATDMRYDVDALIDLYPMQILADPDQNSRDRFGALVPAGVAEHDPPAVPGQPNMTRWVIDPLVSQTTFGVDAAGAPLPPDRAIARFGFRPNAQIDDSWVDQIQGPGQNWQPTSVDVPGLDTASGVVFQAGMRVTLHGERALQVRAVTGITPGAVGNPGTIQWAEPLPPSFTAETVTLEAHEDRYSWLVCVRRQPSTTPPDAVADVDIVVFFRRPTGDALDDERLWPVGGPGVAPAVAGFRRGSNRVRVDFGAAGRPNLKKGSYVLDADNLRWYRVRNVDMPGTQALLTLETAAVASSPPAGGNVMFPRGIVEVYPIGQKTVALEP